MSDNRRNRFFQQTRQVLDQPGSQYAFWRLPIKHCTTDRLKRTVCIECTTRMYVYLQLQTIKKAFGQTRNDTSKLLSMRDTYVYGVYNSIDLIIITGAVALG